MMADTLLDPTGEHLLCAAKLIAERARELASWSKRIPRSVRISGNREHMRIAAGGARAPQAYTFENPRGGPGVWHPVFGHGPRNTWHWVRQTPRPFLSPAADEIEDRAAREWGDGVVDEWARENGYR